MEAERPIIVDREGRHLVWDGSSHTWVDAGQREEDREWFNRYPESMSGEDPARDTEISSNPRSFGTFGAYQEHGFEESVPLDYTRDQDPDFARDDKCHHCGAPLATPEGDCAYCGMNNGTPPLYQGTGQNGDGFGSGFPDVVPKMNYLNQGDNGATSNVHTALDFAAPAPPGGLDFGAPAPPGMEGIGGKRETHRFVIDRNGGMFLEPATMEHSDIVDKYGLDEAARGSVYNDQTADVHRSWVPLDKGSVERDLGHYMGQHSIPINYMPGQSEGVTEGMGARGVPIKGVQGYIWKQEMGIPHPQLAAHVPLIFAAEHSTPDDFPAYEHAKGFLTATGGATSHAVVEGRNRNMGGAVGIGPDYNKVQHGAPVSIEDDGSVMLGTVDPNSTVNEYFQRGDQDWQNAEIERQRREQEFKQRVPEWQRPNRGGSVYDKSQDQLAIEAMTFGPKVAANLDECPECGDVMMERPNGKVCANCGHTQKIIQMDATAKTAGVWDTVKDVGERGVDFAQEHPWETAALVGGLAIPGVGLAADAGLLGGAAAAGEAGSLAAGELGAGAAAEGAGLAGAEGAGLAGAEGAGAAGAAGEAGSAAAMPGRVKTLMNGAKSLGKGALINQGIQSLVGGIGGAGAGGQTTPVNDYQGLVASADPRFDMWQYGVTAAEDDPDSLQLGGMSNDGDDVDPAESLTKGNQEQTGESLDELLKGLSDDGSANQGPYSPEQDGALKKFNDQLPVIIELALDDSKDHSDHPVIQELEHLLSQAFPGESLGDEHHDEHHEPEHHGEEDDEHKPEEQEEAHEVDKSEPKISHNGCTGEDCKFCANKGKLPGMTSDDEDEDEESDGPSEDDIRAMDEAEIKESKTAGEGDVSEAELEAIFAGEPVLELVDHVGGVFHETTMPVGPSGKGPRETEIEEAGAKEEEDEDDDKRKAAVDPWNDYGFDRGGQNIQCPGCHNKLNGTEKFCPECGTPQGEGQLPGDPNAPHSDLVDSMYQRGGEQWNDHMGGKTAAPATMEAPQQHDPVTPQRVIPGPDSAVDKGHPWQDKTGAPLEEGKTYTMRSKNYDVPDEVKIEKIKPTSVVVQTIIHNDGAPSISFPNEISKDEFLNDGLSFEPHVQSAPEVSPQPEHGAQQDSAPGAGEQTDLSTPTQNLAHDEPIAEEVEAEPIVEPVDGLIYTDQKTGDPISYNEYAASLRSSAPPELAWLWDNVKADVEVSDREAEIMQMTAGKNFNTAEQREFINEPGEARNKDKLDLEGTHYLMDDSDDDELWFN